MKLKRCFLLCLASLLLAGGSIPYTLPVKAAEEIGALTDSAKTGYDSYISGITADSGETPADISVTGDIEFTIAAGSSVSLEIKAEVSAFYSLRFLYACLPEGKNDPSFSLCIDGEIPSSGAETLSLRRYWEISEIKKDVSGNDIRGEMTLFEDWVQGVLNDASGIEEKPYRFYLTAGKHTLTFKGTDGICKIKNLTAYSYAEPVSYEEFLSANSDTEIFDGDLLSFEAENASLVSSRSVIANSDMTSVLTTPNSTSASLLNILGGSNWKKCGDSVIWEVDVPKKAFYRISFRFKQDSYQGFTSFRELAVNGEVQYRDAQAIPFSYGDDWQTYSSDKYILLEKGKNTISLKCVLGESAELLKKTNSVISSLNSLYSSLLMVIGSNPDSYRDYHLEREIPNLTETVTRLADEIDGLCKDITSLFGENKGQISALSDSSRQLRDIAANLRSVTKGSRLQRLKSNISSVASFAAKLQGCPLAIDRFTLGGEEKPDLHSVSFLKKAGYSLKRFIASFTSEYNAASGNGNRKISVWIATGRDQLQVMRGMVESDFSPRSGIQVNVRLVTGSVIQATLAGKGPDVALARSETDIMNFAVRNAICDLKSFEGFDTLSERFSKTAMQPYTYRGAVYALPMTQSFNMMFVRTDILENLGVAIPDTWEDLITVTIPTLQRSNLSVGLGLLNKSANINASNQFYTLLYQTGGALYNDSLTACAMDTAGALEAFDKAVSLYREYGIPQEYDFLNRFRTGENPIIIDAYTNYNNIKAGAPELEGLWEMLPIPGTSDENGNINRTQLMASTGCVIFKNAKDKNACFEFLDWFTGDKAQTEYGIEIESVLGASGRYDTANINAMGGLGWSSSQLSLLEKQRAESVSFVQLPGSYYTAKEINNALVVSVTNTDTIPREKLLEAVELINAELARKRAEFEKE